MCNVIKYCVPFSTSPLVRIHKRTQKKQWQDMADWRHVQITCSISENHVAEIQLHPSPFNNECNLLEHTQTKKAANSYRTGLELDFQEMVNTMKVVKLCK